MHGLRCSGELHGWTRLLDEWCVGFGEPPLAGAGSSPFATEEATLATLAEAARRVRKFAQKGDEPVVPGPRGELRFELQGIDYVVRTRQLWPESLEGLSEAVQSGLDEASRELASFVAPAEDQVAVALVFVTPRLGGLGEGERYEALQHLRNVSRHEPSDGAGWLLPVPGSDYGAGAVDPSHPGAALFFRIVR